MITGLELNLRETEEDFNKEKHRNHGKKTTLTLIMHALIKKNETESCIFCHRGPTVPPIGILYMTVKVLLDVGMLQVWLMERK